MSSDANAPRPSSQAERLFVEHALQSEGPLEIETLCRAYPALEDDLRELLRRWTAALHGASLIDRLRSRHGPELALDVSLEAPPGAGAAERRVRPESPAAGPADSVYARIGAHAGRSNRYRPEGEIARGGMGAILRVWDEDLRRTLAMKVALTRAGQEGQASSAAAADSRLLNRFLEEAQITGQLEHPGIPLAHEHGLDSHARPGRSAQGLRVGGLRPRGGRRAPPANSRP